MALQFPKLEFWHRNYIFSYSQCALFGQEIYFKKRLTRSSISKHLPFGFLPSTTPDGDWFIDDPKDILLASYPDDILWTVETPAAGALVTTIVIVGFFSSGPFDTVGW